MTCRPIRVVLLNICQALDLMCKGRRLAFLSLEKTCTFCEAVVPSKPDVRVVLCDVGIICDEDGADKTNNVVTLWLRCALGSSEFSLEWKFRVSG